MSLVGLSNPKRTDPQPLRRPSDHQIRIEHERTSTGSGFVLTPRSLRRSSEPADSRRTCCTVPRVMLSGERRFLTIGHNLVPLMPTTVSATLLSPQTDGRTRTARLGPNLPSHLASRRHERPPRSEGAGTPLPGPRDMSQQLERPYRRIWLGKYLREKALPRSVVPLLFDVCAPLLEPARAEVGSDERACDA